MSKGSQHTKHSYIYKRSCAKKEIFFFFGGGGQGISFINYWYPYANAWVTFCAFTFMWIWCDSSNWNISESAKCKTRKTCFHRNCETDKPRFCGRLFYVFMNDTYCYHQTTVEMFMARGFVANGCCNLAGNHCASYESCLRNKRIVDSLFASLDVSRTLSNYFRCRNSAN